MKSGVSGLSIIQDTVNPVEQDTGVFALVLKAAGVGLGVLNICPPL